MAHEISHVYWRHMSKMMEKARVATVASLIGALASIFLGGALAAPLLVGAMAAGGKRHAEIQPGLRSSGGLNGVQVDAQGRV